MHDLHLTRLILILSLMLGSFYVFAEETDSLPPLPNLAQPTLPNIPKPTLPPKPPQLQAEAYILIDADSGMVLAEKNSRIKKEPASLTKVLTSIVIYDHINNNQLKLDDQIMVSKNAWTTEGSKMFLPVGKPATVDDLIKGIVILSANDACIALAEHIAGSTEAFVDIMNEKAKQIGMNDSHFSDPVGFSHDDHYTTAYDLALLSRTLIKNYNSYYSTYKEKWFTYNDIKQPNRNRLLWRLPFVDGIKTGHTEKAGYVLAASGIHQGMRLIAVTMNSPTDEARANDNKNLLTFGFRFFENKKLYSANHPISQPKVWYGQSPKLKVGLSSDVVITYQKGHYDQLSATLQLKQPILAPIEKGTELGQVEIRKNDKVIATHPVVALEAVPKAGWMKRLWHSMTLTIQGWFGKDEPIVS